MTSVGVLPCLDIEIDLSSIPASTSVSPCVHIVTRLHRLQTAHGMQSGYVLHHSE